MATVKIYDERYSSLNNIDWDFIGDKQDEISRLHPYPARFIESIPRALIEVLGVRPDCNVLDPFCGSGTTLLEAQKMGINSVGVDLNPIACLISTVKTQEYRTDLLTIGMEIMRKAEAKYREQKLEIPNIPNLDHWFKEDIQKAIFTLTSEINKVNCLSLQNALRFCLSSIIVRVSNQESDTRYAAVENKSSAEDVYKCFDNAVKRLYLSQINDDNKADVKIINKDILTVTPEDTGRNISLVITSPPYPNAYEYWLYHKYRMWWLGYNPIDVREHEIGARPHYQKRNGQTEVDFYNQMASLFGLFNSVVLDGGHVCVVIGRSVIKGKEIDNAMLICDMAEKLNFNIVADIERTIAATKKSFNLKYGKIKTENILIFRKGERFES